MKDKVEKNKCKMQQQRYLIKNCCKFSRFDHCVNIYLSKLGKKQTKDENIFNTISNEGKEGKDEGEVLGGKGGRSRREEGRKKTGCNKRKLCIHKNILHSIVHRKNRLGGGKKPQYR